jgi:hypothetical protein
VNSNSKGARAEGAILGALLKAGYSVLVPFGTLRYDLAIDLPGEGLKRVQCKTARLKPERQVVEFNSCSVRPSGQRVAYYGDADYFGVYCHENDGCYLVPVEAVGSTMVCLRLTPPRGRGNSPVRMAEDYVIKRQ